MPESELLLDKMQVPGAPYSSQDLWQGRDFSLCCNGFLGLCQCLPYLALCCQTQVTVSLSVEMAARSWARSWGSWDDDGRACGIPSGQ